MLLEIARFVLFVVCSFAIGVVGLLLSAIEVTQPFTTWRKSLVFGQAGVLIGMVTYVVYLVLLAGYINIMFLLVLFVALEFSVLVAVILFWFLDSGPSRWAALGFAFLVKFMEGHPSVRRLLQVYNYVIGFGFVIVAGIVYFFFSGYQQTVHALQLVNIVLLLGMIPGLIGLIILLSAPAVDESVRDHVLVNALRTIFTLGIYLAFAVWAFRIAPGVSPEEVGRGLPLQISPLVIVALICLFLVSVVVPYVIGTRRGKQFRVDLHEGERNYVDEIVDALQVPILVPEISALSARLEELSEKLLGKLIEEAEANIGVQTDSQFNPLRGNIEVQTDSQVATLLTETMKDPGALASSDLPDYVIEKAKPIVVADQNPSDLDPLYRHLRWLKELIEQVWQAKKGLLSLERENVLQSEEQEAGRRSELLWQMCEKWRQQWLQTFQDQTEHIEKSIETERSTKRPVLLGASTVASTGTGFFIDKAVGWAWVIFQSSQGH